MRIFYDCLTLLITITEFKDVRCTLTYKSPHLHVNFNMEYSAHGSPDDFSCCFLDFSPILALFIHHQFLKVGYFRNVFRIYLEGKLSVPRSKLFQFKYLVGIWNSHRRLFLCFSNLNIQTSIH